MSSQSFYDGKFYTCVAKLEAGSEVNHSGMKITRINGDHLPSKTKNSVQCFETKGHSFNYFPNIAVRFPFLKILVVSSSHLKKSR